ncbi:MAG: hypothetical protein IIA45_00855 [Bacteroidetes bacterium]|nr:hypothetical protein [Bacteroidota bacterium]
MSWTCPECGRIFRNRNQWHSCIKSDLDQHFINKQENVITTFEKLHDELCSFKDVLVEPVKSAILYKLNSTFVAIKLKKTFLVLDFVFKEEINEFPIHKTLRISKNRVAHYIKLEDSKEVDKQLKSWLRQSYELVAK